ncbi:hypothetical protein Tsubulata_049840, partial [Turnera subulata]
MHLLCDALVQDIGHWLLKENQKKKNPSSPHEKEKATISLIWWKSIL